MKRMMGISGEQSDHKIAGFFDDADEAQRTARYLVSSLKGGHAHVMVLDSSDKNVDAKLEPERRGIWHTLIRAHVWLGLAGAVAGVLVFAILGGIGVAFVAQNPAWSSGLLVLFGAIGGLLLGGAFTIRPDHAPTFKRLGMRSNRASMSSWFIRSSAALSKRPRSYLASAERKRFVPCDS